ncbi:MAG: radical SAM protein [Terriglobia bacterium]
MIESLPILVLYPHARCNCRCVMCDIWKNPEVAEITAEELQSHLEAMERLAVRWVVFSGGEPLMHSDLFRLVEILREKSIRVTVLSTGLLLKRYAQKLATGVDDLIVSLDGPPSVHDEIRRVPGAFSALQDGIRQVKRWNPLLPISARCTVQKRNHACVQETACTAKELGLASISFLAADLTSEAFNRPEGWGAARQLQVALSVEQIETLERNLESLDKTWSGTGFVLENREKLQRIAAHFKAHLGICEPTAPKCNAPWVSAVVEANGTVRPCYFHPPLGSLRSQSLPQILNGFEAQRFRASLDVNSNPVCRRCVCSLHLQQ